jgi:hypothetical protein
VIPQVKESAVGSMADEGMMRHDHNFPSPGRLNQGFQSLLKFLLCGRLAELFDPKFRIQGNQPDSWKIDGRRNDVTVGGQHSGPPCTVLLKQVGLELQGPRTPVVIAGDKIRPNLPGDRVRLRL